MLPQSAAASLAARNCRLRPVAVAIRATPVSDRRLGSCEPDSADALHLPPSGGIGCSADAAGRADELNSC